MQTNLKKMTRRLKVGDTIVFSVFSGERHTAEVQSMEICKDGEKYGRDVRSCDIDKHHGVVSLSDDRWCYFYQVKRIIPKSNGKDKA